MAYKGIVCGVSFAVLLAGGGAYWFLPSRGSSDTTRQARALQDERQVLLGMTMYWKSFRAYPTGDNPAIVRALGGDNPRHTPIFHPRADATNKAGAMLDPWGTAYEITVTPATGPVVRSAGKNKTFGDQDDISMDLRALRPAGR